MKEKKITVMLCSPPPGRSGGISRWSSHVLNYYKNIDKAKNVKLLFFPMGRSAFVGYMGITKRFFYGIVDYVKLLIRYKKRIDIEKPDLVHIVSSASISLLKDIFMLKIAQRLKIKTLVHYRFGRIPSLCEKKNWEYKLLVKVIQLANRIIVIDQKSYDCLLNEGFTTIELLPNPLSPAVEKQISDFRDLKREENKILFVGQVLKTKGIFELLEACKKIKGIKVKVLGYVNEEMKMKIHKFIGSTNVDWLEISGNQPYDVVLKEMITAGVFVLPTYTEGFPNVILESMACACPIVTTPVGAIPEMLDINGLKSLGICVNVKDVKNLRIAINRMLQDRKFAIECGNNARKRVIEEYSMNIIWQKMENIWESVWLD